MFAYVSIVASRHVCLCTSRRCRGCILVDSSTLAVQHTAAYLTYQIHHPPIICRRRRKEWRGEEKGDKDEGVLCDQGNSAWSACTYSYLETRHGETWFIRSIVHHPPFHRPPEGHLPSERALLDCSIARSSLRVWTVYLPTLPYIP